MAVVGFTVASGDGANDGNICAEIHNAKGSNYITIALVLTALADVARLLSIGE